MSCRFTLLPALAEEGPVKLVAALVGEIGFVHHQSAYLHDVSGRWKNDGKKNDASTVKQTDKYCSRARSNCFPDNP